MVHGPSIGRVMLDATAVINKLPGWKTSFDYFVVRDFFELYYEYLLALTDLAKIGKHVFRFERPTGLEGGAVGRSINSVTPAQIRFYRKWSGIIQGSVDANNIALSDLGPRGKIKRAPLSNLTS